MSFEDFQVSIDRDAKPSETWPAALRALWYDARGDWDGAHEQAQADESREGAWVHAYLHRKEGDLGNAGYWYARAGRKLPAGMTLEAEWAQLAQELAVRV